MIEYNDINLQKLGDEIRQRFPKAQFSWYPASQEVEVHDVDELNNTEKQELETLVKAHDPNRKTAAEREQEQRKADRELRKQAAAGLNLDNNLNLKDVVKYLKALEARIEELEENQ